jgi:tetratricopeptide (TPR) repeat protein
MKLWALFAVPLALAVVSTSHATSDGTSTPPRAASQDQDSADAPKTPQQVAEMRAEIYMARKDYSEAALAFQRLLDQNPGSAEYMNKIGIAYQELGQDSLAEHFYKRALKTDKKSAHALNNLGTIEYSRQRFGKAVKYYRRAIDTNGDNQAPIYSNLGYAYCELKSYPKATEAFGKALALDPTVFEPKGTAGTIIQHRSTNDYGTLYFMVAKSYAKKGDAEHTARFLKLARDDGYKEFQSAEKDPDFASVIKDPQVQDVLRNRPPYEAQQTSKPVRN